MSGTSRPNSSNDFAQARWLPLVIVPLHAITTDLQTKARAHHGTREKVQIDAANPR